MRPVLKSCEPQMCPDRGMRPAGSRSRVFDEVVVVMSSSFRQGTGLSVTASEEIPARDERKRRSGRTCCAYGTGTREDSPAVTA